MQEHSFEIIAIECDLLDFELLFVIFWACELSEEEEKAATDVRKEASNTVFVNILDEERDVLSVQVFEAKLAKQDSIIVTSLIDQMLDESKEPVLVLDNKISSPDDVVHQRDVETRGIVWEKLIEVGGNEFTLYLDAHRPHALEFDKFDGTLQYLIIMSSKEKLVIPEFL